MKNKISPINILVIFIVLICSTYAQKYELVWSDEFNGSSLDLTKWEIMSGDGTAYGLPSGWGNNELQWYSNNNITFENGMLVITAKNEIVSGKKYTSARIRTLNKGDWKYGRFEFRAKFPVGRGMWPAIWMMPTSNIYGNWAASGEIDIVEYLGHEPQKVYGTIHYGGQWPNNKQSGTWYTLSTGNFYDSFHEYALEWEEKEIRWYVDGKLFGKQTNWNTTYSGAVFPAPFDQKFHLLINLAVGGNWPGAPDAATVLPQRLEVDYARVYKINNTTGINEGSVIKDFSLFQNYPNPFNPVTTIKYEVKENSLVSLKVYNMTGQEVDVLVNQIQPAGSYNIKYDASRLSSGVYLYQIKMNNYISTKKMMLLK